MSPVVVLDSLLRSAFNLYFGMKNGELSVTPKKKKPKKTQEIIYYFKTCNYHMFT